MANVEPNEIQNLLDEVELLEKTINSIGSTQRKKLNDIKINDVRTEIKGAAAKVDPAQWTQFAEEKQNELRDRLETVRNALLEATGMEGPKEPSHLMFDQYASNKAILLLVAFGFVVAATLLIQIHAAWRKATGTDYAYAIYKVVRVVPAVKDARTKENDAKIELAKRSSKLEDARNKKDDEARKKAQEEFDKQLAVVDHVMETTASTRVSALDALLKLDEGFQTGSADEGSVLLMVILLGGLGGTLHLLGSLVKYVGNRQFKRSWILYYVSLPLNGAILAPIIYMLLRVGILSPTNATSGGSSIANLNLIAIYAFATLTGLFSKVASDKLGEVFRNLFRSEANARDQIRGGNSGASTSSTGKGT